MIRMTLGALALAVVVALPATSRAQQTSPESTTPTTSTSTGASASSHRHHFGRRLFKGVNVTAAEKTQFKAIHQKYEPQMKAARQSGDKATVRSLRTQQLDEMRGVLTPDQQTTFDANRAALRARAKKNATPSSAAPSSAAPSSSTTPQA